jgi:multiple sugar transport system substrate-binding protein
MEQKGAVPFEYDLGTPQEISINLDSQEVKDVLSYWEGLVDDGLIGKEDQFTTDYISGVVGGQVRDVHLRRLGTRLPHRCRRRQGSGEGAVRGRAAAAVGPVRPQVGQLGRLHLRRHDQARDKALAAEVAKDLYADEESLADGWKTQTIFPLNQDVLTSEEFANNPVEFFAGQTANKDVYIPAGDAYEGTTYSPFSVYYYAQLQAQLVKINSGKATGEQAAEALQDSIVKYAKGQGFTVS